MKHDHNYILLKINGKVIQGLCDTGATRSVIDANLVKRLQLKITKSQLNNPFIPADGRHISPLGQRLIIPTTLYVVNNLHPKMILGNDWLKSTRAVIGYRTGILSLYDDLFLCPLEGFNSMQNCLSATLFTEYRTGTVTIRY